MTQEQKNILSRLEESAEGTRRELASKSSASMRYYELRKKLTYIERKLNDLRQVWA